MDYKSKLQNKNIDELFNSILQLDNIEECYRFFEDLCTVVEIKSMAQRLQVAKLLKEGKTYNEIEEKTGASTATISRINRFLNYGSEGYDIVLKRLKIKEKEIEK